MKHSNLPRRIVTVLREFFSKCLACCLERHSTKSIKSDPGVVQVYILMGQSNMLGKGKISGREVEGTLEHAVLEKGLYPYLIDNDGRWTTSPTVRNVRVMSLHGHMKVFRNEFMSIRGDTIGPEFGIGHHLEQAHPDQPVLILKSCIGNRSLGWDLLPPGSKQWEYNGKIYAGYKESPASWTKGTTPPPPKPGDWYAGTQYDTDTSFAKTVLSQLDQFYPEANKYKIAGFFWWQGDKDRYDMAYASTYQQHLVRLIQQLRSDFDAPQAKFVLATLGQTDIHSAKGTEKPILEAMLAVDGNAGTYPDFVGNVATVYSHPLSKGGASNSHYNGNAETYMDIGEAMGQAMVELGAVN